jgi:hypothetical protein
MQRARAEEVIEHRMWPKFKRRRVLHWGRKK